MAEEWGTFIAKVPSDIAEVFEHGDLFEAILSIGTLAGCDPSVLELSAEQIRFEKVTVSGGYVEVESSTGALVDFSNLLVAQGSGVDYFSSHSDEYGTMHFFALCHDGGTLGFGFNQEDCDEKGEAYITETVANLELWKSMVPTDLSRLFPDFINFDSGTLLR